MLFLHEVLKVNTHKEGKECHDDHLYLQLICVLVFQVSVFNELRETFGIFSLVWEASGVQEAKKESRGLMHKFRLTRSSNP